MRKGFAYIRILIIIFISIFLYGFSNSTYEHKKLKDLKVSIYPVDKPFIDHEAVNNLLIQNPDELSNLSIDTLDLMKLERGLKEHQMVENASVFMTVDGMLSAKVYQRKPVARLITDTAFMYIDQQGKIMPTSDNFSARVPLAYGFPAKDLVRYRSVFNAIYDDELHRKLITQVSLKNDSSIVLETRLDNFVVHLGKPKDLTRKLANLKAIYQYLKEKEQLKRYRSVDLRFGKQVIASKN